MTTWGDVLRGRGIDPTAINEKHRRYTQGCVIRALESIARAQATDQEWEMRLAQIEAGRNLPIDQQAETELGCIQLLIAQAISWQTPIGQALAERPMSIELLTPEAMKTSISQGYDLMLISLLIQEHV